MSKLLEYFTAGTSATVSGGRIGIEVETQFADKNGHPIGSNVTNQILSLEIPGCAVRLELGRQNIELSVEPEATFGRLYDKTRRCLAQLYREVRRMDCYAKLEPAPFLHWSGDLFYVSDERDFLWRDIDGARALERLCRCSSVQFTIDVNPQDAIGWINRLWRFRLHEVDYQLNHLLWELYIADSHFGYARHRYGGPMHFTGIDDYVSELVSHKVTMHNDRPCRFDFDEIAAPNIDLFLRSIWWHYRLRRYGDSLALEIRPIARRRDDAIRDQWKIVKAILGL